MSRGCVVFLLALCPLVRAAGLGEDCTVTRSTCDVASFLKCNATIAKCDCMDGYKVDEENVICLAPVGQGCVESNSLRTCINPLSDCMGVEGQTATCHCKSGYTQYGGKCLAPLNSTCISTNGCMDEHAICVDAPATDAPSTAAPTTTPSTTTTKPPTTTTTTTLQPTTTQPGGKTATTSTDDALHALSRAPLLFAASRAPQPPPVKRSGARTVRRPVTFSDLEEEDKICVCDDAFEVDDSGIRCRMSGGNMLISPLSAVTSLIIIVILRWGEAMF